MPAYRCDDYRFREAAGRRFHQEEIGIAEDLVKELGRIDLSLDVLLDGPFVRGADEEVGQASWDTIPMRMAYRVSPAMS